VPEPRWWLRSTQMSSWLSRTLAGEGVVRAGTSAIQFAISSSSNGLLGALERPGLEQSKAQKFFYGKGRRDPLPALMLEVFRTEIKHGERPIAVGDGWQAGSDVWAQPLRSARRYRGWPNTVAQSWAPICKLMLDWAGCYTGRERGDCECRQ